MEKRKADVQICSSAEGTFRDADIIVTATPAVSSLVYGIYWKKSCHVNAMGADTKGKTELDKSVLEIAEIIFDDEHRRRTIGECKIPGLSCD
jgi:alanine dehydrogenase